MTERRTHSSEEWLHEWNNNHFNLAKLHQELMEIFFTFRSKGAMTWISPQPGANAQYKSLLTVVASRYTTLYPMQPSTAATPPSYIARRLSLEAFASNICNQGYVACQGLAAQQENYAGAARQSSRLFPCQPTTIAGHRSTLTASSVWFTGSLRPHFIYFRQHPYASSSFTNQVFCDEQSGLPTGVELR